LQRFERLEALEILPLVICRRNGVPTTVEYSSSAEFTAWVKWNGIPFTGLEEWTFDSKCGIINHALKFGMKLRLIAAPEKAFSRPLRLVQDLFVYPVKGVS
jgi:hypothetical protein